MTLAVCAQARVEIYDIKASAYVPAFIDYRLNCPADVTINILPSDAGGTPTGPAIKTLTLTGQARGFHRYIWLADVDLGGSAPVGYYVAELFATSNQAQWNPIIGLYTNDNWTTEQGARPLPITPDVEGFYGVAVNSNPASPYYGRIYATHKTQKEIYMYRPDGSYLGRMNDDAITWQASAPWDVTVADDGYVYVCDRSAMIIYCFDGNGNYISKSPTTSNHRAIFARTTSDGVTHLIYSGSTQVKKITVAANHTTWQTSPFGGNNLFLCSTGNDYGVWANADVSTIYVADIAGTYNGVSKWNNLAGTWTNETTPFITGKTSATDVSLVDDATDFLWITRQVNRVEDDPTTTQNERVRALYKTNATTNATIQSANYDIITWGLMNCNDRVGNVAITFGKSTATWAQKFWGLFAEAGVYTCSTKRTKAFYLGSTPSPVVVPGSAVWTPDNTIAANNSDSASVSFKVMDVNGWADITSVVLDLRPLGYGSAVACTLAQDMTDPGAQTAIATRTGIVAMVGTRCTTSNGQPVHKLTASPLDATNGGYPDEEEVQLNVTGDPSFDAYVRHRRVAGWDIDGAYIVAVGGGIPGATDPRASGPFTYTSAATVAGYASLAMSAGVFAVNAQKTGFASETPMSVTIPYTGFTQNLYLRPLTIAEARATGNATFVNVEGVCYAQPQGFAPTAAAGLAQRTDTMLKRNQWYVCDPNDPANGMLFMVVIPTVSFLIQWDDPDLTDDFGNSLYMGKRPEVGETIMITGLLDTPGGHERRVILNSTSDIEAAMGASPSTIERIYYNRGNLGGLPGTPLTMTIPNVYHSITQGFWESWGKYGRVTDAIVLAYQADGVEIGVGMTDPVPYYTVGDLAGNTCHVAIDMPASLGIPSVLPIGATYTFTGAVSRRTRNGQGAIRPRAESDIVQTAAVQAVLKTNLVDQAANAVTGAQWRRVGTTTWLNSGALELLSTGPYTVEFKPVTNYVTPANAGVSVTDGVVTTLTGTYTKYGTLKVTLAPAAAITAGAQWRRVGMTTWLNSAATESLPPGAYTVEFKDATGFTKPADLPVTITAAVTTSKTATYNPPTPDELSVVRTLSDGNPVNVHGIVSAKIGSALWIQAEDRSVGIRVEGTSTVVVVGNDAQVLGTMDINADGEMVIVPSQIVLYAPGSGDPAAIDMRSREIGGVACGTTPGVDTGRGALNVGLKIHHLGMVTGIGAGNAFYYVWDGANRADLPVSDGNADGFIGVLVEAAPPAACAAWTDWVDVTGVVGIEAGTGVAAAPKIIPISAAKVTTFDTITADSGTALTAAWNLMSVPAAPAKDSDGVEFNPKPWDAPEVLAPFKTPDEVDGRMYRWENCTGSLFIYDLWSEVGSHGPFGGLLLGDGYWMQLGEEWPVSYSGKNSALDQWIGVCAPGWMIIGQPKDHNTYLADVKVHDGGAVYSMFDAIITNSWLDCVGYWWDNQTQSLVDVGIPDCWGSTDILKPWYGYWIQAYRGDLALIVPETPAAP